VINPADLCALDDALRIKDSIGAEVTVVTVGESQDDDALREALAMGVDRGCLVSDPTLAACDALAIAYVLSRVAQREGPFDLVLTGVASADDGAGIVGPALAEFLGWPHIGNAYGLTLDGTRLKAAHQDGGPRTISLPLPALATIPPDANRPRLPNAARIVDVYSSGAIQILTATDLDLDPARLAATTEVRRSFAPDPLPRCEVMTGDAQDVTRALVARLRQWGFVA